MHRLQTLPRNVWHQFENSLGNSMPQPCTLPGCRLAKLQAFPEKKIATALELAWKCIALPSDLAQTSKGSALNLA